MTESTDKTRTESAGRVLRARVVAWPSPAADGRNGVYAVRVTGLAQPARGALAAAAGRAGLWIRGEDGALVVSGPAPALLACARELAPSARPGPAGAGDPAQVAGPDRRGPGSPPGAVFGQASPGAAAEALAGALERFRTPPRTLEVRGGALDLTRGPLIVGILNATPDSFYDRGRYFDRGAAVARADEMAAEGAHLVEVGGETARPGEPIGGDEESRRVVPLVETLAARLPVPVSVDTYKPEVARCAVEAGAVLINDISGLADPRMAAVAAGTGAALVVMHIRGRPKVRQIDPRYESVMDEVYAFLQDRTAAARRAGVSGSRLVVDPGFSFGKTARHDVEMLRRFGEFRSLGYPLYLATSRKNYIRDVLGLPFEELLEGTAAAVAYGAAQGAHLVRTHDVRFMARLVRMVRAITAPATASAE